MQEMLPPPRAWVQKALLVSAIGAVFLVAYLDLQREEARALDQFVAEQGTLARAVAASLAARIDGIVADLEGIANSQGDDPALSAALGN
jgi:hypothetical protein